MDATKRWYALYTKSRAEKKVAEELQRDGVEVYLPLQKTLKLWSDRKKMVHEPLFRSYVFVKVRLAYPGAVCYVTIGNEKVSIPEAQIEAVRTYLGEREQTEPLEYFQYDDAVEVAFGPLKGLRGSLIDARDHRKLMVQIDAINQNITLTLPSHLLKKV